MENSSTHTIIGKGAKIPAVCVGGSSRVPLRPERSSRNEGKQPAEENDPDNFTLASLHHLEVLEWIFDQVQPI